MMKNLRKKTGLNQTQFWNRIGVTQSAGSRYENGRAIPTPTVMLINLAYGPEKQAQKAFTKLRGLK